MKKYILFDFDGVITSRRNSFMAPLYGRKPNLYGLEWFDPFCLVNLMRISDEADADIIVSSPWRTLGHESLERLWKHNNVLRPWRFVGTTPAGAKRDAIEAWTAAHPDDRYVILDAEDLRLQNQVRTDPEIGLTLANAREAIAILNNED